MRVAWVRRGVTVVACCSLLLFCLVRYVDTDEGVFGRRQAANSVPLPPPTPDTLAAFCAALPAEGFVEDLARAFAGLDPATLSREELWRAVAAEFALGETDCRLFAVLSAADVGAINVAMLPSLSGLSAAEVRALVAATAVLLTDDLVPDCARLWQLANGPARSVTDVALAHNVATGRPLSDAQILAQSFARPGLVYECADATDHGAGLHLSHNGTVIERSCPGASGVVLDGGLPLQLPDAGVPPLGPPADRTVSQPSSLVDDPVKQLLVAARAGQHAKARIGGAPNPVKLWRLTTQPELDLLMALLGDTTPPVALTLAPVPPYTREASITLSGSAEPFGFVVMSGAAAATVPVDASGSFAVNVALAANQPNAFALVPCDAALNCGPAVTASTIHDDRAPAVAITDPVPGALVASGTIAVSGTVADANPVSVRVNGVAAALSGGSFAAAGVPVSTGTTAITATATDAAGNSAMATIPVTTDPWTVVAMVGPEGGIVEASADSPLRGTAIVVPPEAVAAPTPVGFALSRAAPPLDPTLAPLGPTLDMLPAGAHFHIPVRVVLPFAPGLAQYLHIDPATVVLLTTEEAGSPWQPVRDATVRHADGVVEAAVTDFSWFTVAGLYSEDLKVTLMGGAPADSGANPAGITNGAPATATYLGEPSNLLVDDQGTLFFLERRAEGDLGDTDRIRKIQGGVISTVYPPDGQATIRGLFLEANRLVFLENGPAPTMTLKRLDPRTSDPPEVRMTFQAQLEAGLATDPEPGTDAYFLAVFKASDPAAYACRVFRANVANQTLEPVVGTDAGCGANQNLWRTDAVPGLEVQLDVPMEVEPKLVAGEGSVLFMADGRNRRVLALNVSTTATVKLRGVDVPPRHVLTVAGNEAAPPSGAGGPAEGLGLCAPLGLAAAGSMVMVSDNCGPDIQQGGQGSVLVVEAPLGLATSNLTTRVTADNGQQWDHPDFAATGTAANLVKLGITPSLTFGGPAGQETLWIADNQVKAIYRIDFADADGDGVGDSHDRCPGYDDRIDVNHNGIPDACEDTDGDGLLDGDEVRFGTDPTKADTNGDGIDDCAQIGCTPGQVQSPALVAPDWNHDGIIDALDPDPDPDHDGILTREEDRDRNGEFDPGRDVIGLDVGETDPHNPDTTPPTVRFVSINGIPVVGGAIVDVGRSTSTSVVVEVNDDQGVYGLKLWGPGPDATLVGPYPVTRTSPPNALPATFVGAVPLLNGHNAIRAVGIDAAGNRRTAIGRAATDLLPPRATLLWPADGSTVGSGTIALSMAFSEDVTVATSVTGLSGARSAGVHTSSPLVLSPGLNQFTVALSDTAGNTASQTFSVHYVPAGRLSIVAGDGQVGAVGAPASNLVVQLERPDGSGVWHAVTEPGVAVRFEGAISHTATTGSDGRATTAAASPALLFKSGVRRVRAFLESSPERPVQFDLFGAVDCNLALPGLQPNTQAADVTKLVVLSGDGLLGDVAARLYKPLRVVAVDGSGCVVEGAGVSFAITSTRAADGTAVGALVSPALTTDATGVAAAGLDLGSYTDTESTDPAVLLKRNPWDQEAQRVGVNRVRVAAAKAGVAPVDIAALAMPRGPNAVFACDDNGGSNDWILEGEATMPVGTVACVRDQFDNPVADSLVAFVAGQPISWTVSPTPVGSVAANPPLLNSRFDDDYTGSEHRPLVLRTDAGLRLVTAAVRRSDYLGMARASHVMGTMAGVKYACTYQTRSSSGAALSDSLQFWVAEPGGDGTRRLYLPHPVNAVWGGMAPTADVVPAGYTMPPTDVGTLCLREDLQHNADGTLARLWSPVTGQQEPTGNRTVFIDRAEFAGFAGPTVSASSSPRGRLTLEASYYDTAGVIRPRLEVGFTAAGAQAGLNQPQSCDSDMWAPLVSADGTLSPPANADPTRATRFWGGACTTFSRVWGFGTSGATALGIASPSGNPTDPATAAATNEFVFDESLPSGNLAIPVDVTSTVPQEYWPQLARRTRWLVSAIGDSHAGGQDTQLSWSQSWPGEPTVGRGLRATATFTGLPRSNADLGLKTIELRWRADDGADFQLRPAVTTAYEVFFPKFGTNHPPDADSDVPNWYYYWSQVVGASRRAPTNPASSCGTAVPEMDFAPTLQGLGAFAPGDSVFHVGTAAADCHSFAESAHASLCGVDLLAYVVASESQRYAWWCDWWNNDVAGYQAAHLGRTDPAGDFDGDGLPNYVEDVNLDGTWDHGPTEPFDWSASLTTGAPLGPDIVSDLDWMNAVQNRLVDGQAYYPEDWACPGRNCSLIADPSAQPADCGSCGAPNRCFNGACCVPAACLPGACGSQPDGCGGVLQCTCGLGATCLGGECCSPVGCTPGDCGSMPDGCGGTRTCPSCSGGAVCAANRCCAPKTCKELGAACGPTPDGCGGTLDCGTCPGGDTCFLNQCCTRLTCEQTGCGGHLDGCGGQLFCQCPDPLDTCMADGTCCRRKTCVGHCGGFTDCGAQVDCGPCSSGDSCIDTVCVDTSGPSVTILSPADLSDVGHAATVQVTFRVNDNHGVASGELLGWDGQAITATRTTPAGQLPADFSASVPLLHGENTLFAVGVDPTGNRALASVRVRTDLRAPAATAVWPANGATVQTQTIALKVAFDEAATVVSTNIPGLSGSVAQGLQTFSVTLVAGANLFNVTLNDAATNQATSSFTIYYGPRRRLQIVSGDGQVGVGSESSALAGTAAPLVVRVDEWSGSAWASKAGASVDFDGPFVVAPSTTPQVLTVLSDGQGLASTAAAVLKLLPGVQRVRAHFTGAESPFVEFDLFGAADANPATPELDPSSTGTPVAALHALTGPSSMGDAGAGLCKPVRAVAVDANGYVVPGAGVTLTVKSTRRGDGARVGGVGGDNLAITTATDAAGRVETTLTLGASTDTKNQDPATPASEGPELLLKRNPEDTEPQRVGVNWVQVTSGSAPPVDFQAYAFPGAPAQVFPCHADGTPITVAAVHSYPLFAPVVRACVVDGATPGNPVANVDVRFVVDSAVALDANGDPTAQAPTPRGGGQYNPQFADALFALDHAADEWAALPLRFDPGAKLAASRTQRTGYLGQAAVHFVLGNMALARYKYHLEVVRGDGTTVTGTGAVDGTMPGFPVGDQLGRNYYEPQALIWSSDAPAYDVGPAGSPKPTGLFTLVVIREDVWRKNNGDLNLDSGNRIQGNRTFYVNRAERAGTPGPEAYASNGNGTIYQPARQFGQSGVMPFALTLGSQEGDNDVGTHGFDWCQQYVQNDGTLPGYWECTMPLGTIGIPTGFPSWFENQIFGFSTTATYKLLVPPADGDPVARPTKDNEFVFNEAFPEGLLMIPFRASFYSSAGHRQAFHKQTRWTVTPIAGSTLGWSTSWPGEPAVGRGLGPIAFFRGLPQDNDQFGLKHVTMAWQRENGTTHPVWVGATAPYEVFFSRLGRNHPPDMGPDVKNWFYYWSSLVTPSLVSAPSGSACKAPACPSLTPGMAYDDSTDDPELLLGYFNKGRCDVTISWKAAACDYTPEAVGGTPGDPKRLCGIDLFTHTAVHESQHFAWSCEWWNNSDTFWADRKGGDLSQDDKDGDGLPNWVEDENLNQQWDNGEIFDWNDKLTSTCPWPSGTVKNDEEWKNYRDHASVTGAPYYAKDWSYPGSNARVTVYVALH